MIFLYNLKEPGINDKLKSTIQIITNEKSNIIVAACASLFKRY